MIKTAINPLVQFCKVCICNRNKVASFKVTKKVARSVPYFVTEAASEFEGILINQNILSLSTHKSECKLKGIGTVNVDKLKRVHSVSKRLRHFTALLVANETVNVNIMKRSLACKFKTGHNHTAYPEEDNIISSYKSCCRIEVFKIFCFLWPSQSRERPEPRAEPGIEYVFILLEIFCTATTFRALGWVCAAYDHFTTLLTVPNRNSVAPPNLAAYTPVADIYQPLFICIFPFLWEELNLARLPCGKSLVCHWLHFYKPLVAQVWLNYSFTAVAVSNRVNHFFLALKEACSCQIFYYKGASLLWL